VLNRAHTVFGRAEWIQKSADDLVLDVPPTNFPPDRLFGIGTLTLGYIAEFARWSGATLGLGGLGAVNVIPESLKSSYGSRVPVGGMIFLRLRPLHSPEPSHSMPGMPMGDGGSNSRTPSVTPFNR
jgi:hypothetical protein